MLGEVSGHRSRHQLPVGPPPSGDQEHPLDLDLVEATPEIAVLQILRIRPGPSATVRFEIKNGLIHPLRCA